ncbi:eb05a09b-c4ce-4a42-af30-3804b19c2fa1 [Sclerotinia trifoliorum]|uniref:Eb05a09b-c4ce-4a42-af30-3804b19c2fa1 n=1 Tax=Sclerotinia trifoliorum TaxID=28548 RepID=A0A8H2VZ56_9HELO|nr:eb05a09b-c4ce-4a42-af30-3804b19c2fa1 [Sclerotinia trifoliorum]
MSLVSISVAGQERLLARLLRRPLGWRSSSTIHFSQSRSHSRKHFHLSSTHNHTPKPPTHHIATQMSPSAQFIDLLKARRTIYALEAKSPIPDAKIQEIVEQIILHTPSSFNSQSTRVVLLFKEEHEKLWDIAKDALKAVVPEAQFEATAQRVAGFRAGYGSILFFEDRSVVSKMQAGFATYADKFPGWAAQSDAMTQHAIWVALAAEGLGANLQHYSPLIDAKVAEQWKIPADWELNAQLVFGTPVAAAGEKTFAPLEERFKVFGA